MGSVGTLIAWASVILKLEFALPLGSVFGSILGGRWSGRTLARLKAANDGIGYPEVSQVHLSMIRKSYQRLYHR
jgi:hypothetical protein